MHDTSAPLRNAAGANSNWYWLSTTANQSTGRPVELLVALDSHVTLFRQQFNSEGNGRILLHAFHSSFLWFNIDQLRHWRTVGSTVSTHPHTLLRVRWHADYSTVLKNLAASLSTTTDDCCDTFNELNLTGALNSFTDPLPTMSWRWFFHCAHL